jgi:putative tryptophan/tyrosine transport system substrate-binding protein
MYPNRRNPGPLGEAMRRRDFIVLMGGAAGVLPLAARAQQPAKKMLRVGAVSGAPKSSPNWTAFLRRLADLGYQEGKNFTFDLVPAPNDDEYETGYRTLEGRDPDIIIAPGSEIALKSALAASRTLPIVMIAIDFDPFARGYVTSLARPSGNVTGISFQQIELAAKRIELVKEAFPNMPGATLFWDQWSADQWQAAQNAALTLGLRLFGIELRKPPYDYERALAEAPSDHRGLVIVATSVFFFRDRTRIADFASRHRIPSMFVFREWVQAGGLLSYGPNITALFGRAAEFVDRIAKGAKPADLPIEQPTKFELVVNLKAARAIGIELPTGILLRADEVIE